jgi:hypothetical protein
VPHRRRDHAHQQRGQEGRPPRHVGRARTHRAAAGVEGAGEAPAAPPPVRVGEDARTAARDTAGLACGCTCACGVCVCVCVFVCDSSASLR